MSTLDKVDLSIIRELQENGRAANVEIARRLGVAEGTVRKRLDRLLAEGIIRPTVDVHLEDAGLSQHVWFGLRTEPSTAGRVLEALRRRPEVRSLYYVSGEYDILAEAAFPAAEDLLRFLAHHIAELSGVRQVTTLHVLNAAKGLADWPLPERTEGIVLVVDDDPDFVEFCRMVLGRAGCQVVSASNGEEALSQVRLLRPHLILMDVMMKDIWDGLDAAGKIRRDPAVGRIPILIVSSIADSHYAGMFSMDETLPADGFLTKPIAPERLLTEVRRLLAGAEGRK